MLSKCQRQFPQNVSCNYHRGRGKKEFQGGQGRTLVSAVRMHSNWLKLRRLSVQLSNCIWPPQTLWPPWTLWPVYPFARNESNAKVAATSRFISIKIKALKICRLHDSSSNNNNQSEACKEREKERESAPWRRLKVSAIFVEATSSIWTRCYCCCCCCGCCCCLCC